MGDVLRGAGLDDRGLVRVGDTVRRPAGAWTDSVHDLLRAIRADGFDIAPEPGGRDEQGREVLAYRRGADAGFPFYDHLLSDRGAERLGRMATRLRHVLGRYDCPPGARWQFDNGAPKPGQTLQHGDLGPWNLLWDPDGHICGVLDWDFAGPGDPWYDTAHLAWFTVPFMDDERAATRGFPEPPDRRARMSAFAAGAGITERELIRIVQTTQLEYANRVRTRPEPWTMFRARGFDAYALADHAWTTDHFG